MSNDIIATDLQGQYVDSPLVYLYELDLGDGVILYFHPGLDSNLSEVRFYSIGAPSSDNTSLGTTNPYVALPIMLEGLETKSEGAANRPMLTIANVTSIFRAALGNEGFTFEELIGKRITCRRTFEKYLYGGSEQSNPMELPLQTYLIDRVSGESNMAVEFELTAPFDVSGVRVPNRVVVGKYCTWEYQGYEAGSAKSGCSWPKSNTVTYNGTLYQIFFDTEDRPLIPSTAVTFSVWSAGSYNKNSFVSHNSKYWRSEIDLNEDEPSTDNINWQEMLLFTAWTTGGNYSINDLVRYDNKIWKCRIAHSSGQTPSYTSIYWTRVDYCSKQLKGCKSRFQFVPYNSFVPSATKSTTKTLPFGAYLGTAKFK